MSEKFNKTNVFGEGDDSDEDFDRCDAPTLECDDLEELVDATSAVDDSSENSLRKEANAEAATIVRPSSSSTPSSGGDQELTRIEAPDKESARQIWGDFEINELLGAGGMGSVYRGCQISLDREVAIKVLTAQLADDESFLKRFDLEAKAVAKISSPHVVHVIAAGEFKGQHYFAMEYVKGQDLSNKLKTGFKPSFTEALDIVSQAAKGLAAANELNIIHRDIKPGNMMITQKGLVKLMDFGLVKLTGTASPDLTMAGTMMGTVSYFSPEQGRGDYCDHRTDIYALGVVLYQLLTGVLPFSGGNPTSVIYQHNHVEPKPPKEINPKIPEDFQAIVLKCMQKEAADRYATAHDLIEDIERVRRGRSPSKALVDPKTLRSGGTLIKSRKFSLENKASVANIILQLIALVLLCYVGYLFAQFYSTKNHILSLKHAQSLLKDRKYLQCREVIDANVAVSPSDFDWLTLRRELNTGEGQYILGISQHQFKRYKFAASRMNAEQALGRLPRNKMADEIITVIDNRQASLEYASQLLDNNDFQECRSILEANMEAWPGDDEWLHLQTVLDAKETASLLVAAETDINRYDYKSADAKVVKILAMTPNHTRASELKTKIEERTASFTLARQKLNDGEFEKCREIVEVNLSVARDDPEWDALLGELNHAEGGDLLALTMEKFNQGAYDLARANARRILELVPDDKQAKKVIDDLDMRQQALDQAGRLITESDYKGCRDIIDTNLIVWVDDPEWKKLLDQLDHNEGNDYLTRAKNEFKSFQFKQAKATIARALELLKDSSDATDFAAKMEEREKALAAARGHLGEESFQECRSVVDPYLQTSPDDPEWIELRNELNKWEGEHFSGLAKDSFEQGDFEKARVDATRAKELLPKDTANNELLGKLDDYGKALVEAESLLKENNFSQARRLLNAQISLFPQGERFVRLKEELNVAEGQKKLISATTAFENGQIGEARRDAEVALGVLPDNAEVMALIARLDDRDEALKRAKQFLDSGNHVLCREIVDFNLGQTPNDYDWIDLRDRLAGRAGSETVGDRGAVVAAEVPSGDLPAATADFPGDDISLDALNLPAPESDDIEVQSMPAQSEKTEQETVIGGSGNDEVDQILMDFEDDTFGSFRFNTKTAELYCQGG